MHIAFFGYRVVLPLRCTVCPVTVLSTPLQMVNRLLFCFFMQKCNCAARPHLHSSFYLFCAFRFSTAFCLHTHTHSDWCILQYLAQGHFSLQRAQTTNRLISTRPDHIHTRLSLGRQQSCVFLKVKYTNVKCVRDKIRSTLNISMLNFLLWSKKKNSQTLN